MRPLDGDGICPAETSGKELVFIARDLPSLGYRTYVPAESSAHAIALACRFGRPYDREPLLQVHVRSCQRHGLLACREAIGPGVGRTRERSGGSGSTFMQRFDAKNIAGFVDVFTPAKPEWALIELGKPSIPPADKVAYRAASPERCQMHIERSPVSLTAVFHAKPSEKVPHAVTSKFSVYAGLPYVDIEITLHDKSADPWPEAGWICLPFALQSPRFRLGRQNSIIDPVKDVVPATNRHLFGINSGLAVLNPQDLGVGLCPMDHPLVSLERPGCWRYSLDFVPQKPIVFVHLFNNQFTSNFRMWNEGTLSSRVRIWAIDRYNPERDLVTPSLEARFPLIAAKGNAPPGPLPPTQPGLELSRKGVQVTAFGPNPDGEGIILRFWEQAGQDGVCTVKLPEALRSHKARLCNLRGEPSPEPIQVRGGSLNVPLTHFAPTSVLLTQQNKPGRVDFHAQAPAFYCYEFPSRHQSHRSAPSPGRIGQPEGKHPVGFRLQRPRRGQRGAD